MRCPLCSHDKTYKHGKTSKGSQRYRCLNCKQTFTDTFDTIYYRRQTSCEKVRIVLQSHCEGNSLRGISRISEISYNTGVSLIRVASQKAQQVHNAEVQGVDTSAWLAKGRIGEVKGLPAEDLRELIKGRGS